ncbi:MAG: hypothetical protein AB1521_06265 [Bacteroidota bacterium]
MIEPFEKRKELEKKIDKAKWINLAKVILNRFGLDILLAFKDAREKEILNDTIQFLQDKNIENVLEILRISKDVSELKSNFDHFISKNSEITKEFLFFIKAKNHFPKVLSNFKIYLNDLLSPNDPLKFLYDNDLFFFPEAENNIINKIENVFSQNLSKCALISGSPESGKTIIGLKIGSDFIKIGYSVYYFRFDNLRNPDLLIQDLFMLNNDENPLVIADNCHMNISEASYICQNLDKYRNIHFLFLSRSSEQEDYFISEYDDVNFLDFFQNNYFTLSSKYFDEKASGIIQKYKAYYESKYSHIFEIGNIQFVVNNSHKNLVTLFYNLEFWTKDLRLDKLDKKEIFKKIFHKYLANKPYDKLLLLSSLYKYEIYYEAKEHEISELNDLLKNGIIRQHPSTNYFYLYHSSFAKLLLNSFTIHTSFKRFKSLDDYIYIQIRDYLLSFDDYPLNLENLFHNLINNHGQIIAIKLLQEQKIFEMFVNYFNNCGYSLNLIFILYRIQQRNFNLAKELFNKIPTSTWVNNFRSLSLSSLSVGLIKLSKTASEKASEVIKHFSIEELAESARKTKLNLLANSLRELDKLTGQSIIGRKIYSKINDEELIPKVAESSLAHIGKSFSELFYVDQLKTTSVFNKIDKSIIVKKISESDIKYISKALCEFNKIDSEYSSIIYQSMDNDLLISKLYETTAEGIGRSLNEFNSIDIQKTKTIFEKLDNTHIINLLTISTIEQVAHSLSEMFLVNEDKTKQIYYALDTQSYLNKIHNKNTTLQKLGNALKNFRKIDEQKTKLKEIINSINSNLFSKRAKSIDFNKLCISLSDISIVNRELALNIFNGIPQKDILIKAQNEKLQNIGRSLSKLKSIDKDLVQRISSSIDWQKTLLKGKNITLAQIANSLSDLNKSDKHLAKNIYHSLEIDFLTKLAAKSETSSLRHSLRKLRKVDEKKTINIFESLKSELSKT